MEKVVCFGRGHRANLLESQAADGAVRVAPCPFGGPQGSRAARQAFLAAMTFSKTPTCRRLSIHAAVRACGLSAGDSTYPGWSVCKPTPGEWACAKAIQHLQAAASFSYARREASLKRISNIPPLLALRSALCRMLPRDRCSPPSPQTLATLILPFSAHLRLDPLTLPHLPTY
jgi:hypothetical protein